MADKRNLVVLFDGTWNTPENRDGKLDAPTNVKKFSDAIASLNYMQRQRYEEGVGTDFQEHLIGGALGAGITDRLLKGYSFLQERFADPEFKREDNKVYIFGFSRGAYAARLLSHLIDWSGIPKESRDCEESMAKFLKKQKASKLKASGRFFDISVEMVGVWDTVKSSMITKNYKDTVLPKIVVAGYHAMALDEKRALFPVLRWKDAGKRATELWFAGVHSNVGGGYANSGLSDIALRWMIDRAREHGLKFKVSELDKITPDPLGEKRDSYKESKLPGIKLRKVMNSDLVHESVRQRIEANIGYKPDVARWPANPCYKF